MVDFVDAVKQEGIWGRDRETVIIAKIEQFSLKVEVFFAIAETKGQCYGARLSCKCFEAAFYQTLPLAP